MGFAGWVEADLSGRGRGRQAGAVNQCSTPLSAQFVPPLPSPDVKEVALAVLVYIDWVR